MRLDDLHKQLVDRVSRRAEAEREGGLLGQLTKMTRETVSSSPNDQLDVASFSWHRDARALHTQVSNPSAQPATMYKHRFGDPAMPKEWALIPLQPGESFRFMSAKSSADEQGVKVAIPPQCSSSPHEIFDRAHFPTVQAAADTKNGDVSSKSS